jgi:hypothetical protein
MKGGSTQKMPRYHLFITELKQKEEKTDEEL